MNVISMKKYDKDGNTEHIKALLVKASDFTFNGHPITVDKIDTIHTFQIMKGDFLHANYKFTGIASITINHLSRLYKFEGYANENEIIGSINIDKTH